MATITQPQTTPNTRSHTDKKTMPLSSTSEYPSWSGEPFNPRHTNPQHSHEDIIPVVVTNVLLSSSSPTQDSKSHSISKLFKHKSSASEHKDGNTKTKTVFMPRSEYLKYFARDDEGVYVGSEEEREWSEQELDGRFGGLRPMKGEERNAGFVDRLFMAKAEGL